MSCLRFVSLRWIVQCAGWMVSSGVAFGCSADSDAPSASGGASASGGRSSSGGTVATGGRSGSTGGVSSGGRSSTGGGSGGPPAPTGNVFGNKVSGQYHLGPVDFAESQWHNACAPAGGYRSELRSAAGLGGEFLAGLSNEMVDGGARCDACIRIETAKGKSIVARVVTYGVEAEPGDIDVSPSVYEALNTGEYPRSMSWQFTECPGSGTIQYEFQTGANVWWTSFWVRNAKLPVEKVEVQSANHASFTALRRELDGTLNADSGFGEGPFTLRLTGPGGRVLTDSFSGFEPGQVITSQKQF